MDEELNNLLRNVTIAQGGVLPHIQPVLTGSLEKPNETDANSAEKNA
jgi:hypothetical protein